MPNYSGVWTLEEVYDAILEGNWPGSGFSLINAVYDSVSLDVSSEDINPNGIAFNNDGTKMYISGNENASVYQYSLSSAFDLSTASYDSVSFSVASQGTEPQEVTFNNDGTKMYVIDNGAGDESVYQYSLSSAFDLSTASYDSASLNINSEEITPRGLAFNNDGTKMYITGSASDEVHQYSLSSAFDLSTASYDSVSFSVASEDGGPQGIAFNLDGTKMFIIGGTTNAVYQYTLSPAFDMSTASYDSVSFSVAPEVSDNSRGISFSSDGTKMFVVGSTNDSVFQYSTEIP